MGGNSSRRGRPPAGARLWTICWTQPGDAASPLCFGPPGVISCPFVPPVPELSWLNWCLTGSCLFSLVLILFFRESYDRLYLDVFVSV